MFNKLSAVLYPKSCCNELSYEEVEVYDVL